MWRRLRLLKLSVAALWMVAGCSPALNWRDAPIGNTPLLALFPCQPDQGRRTVHLGAALHEITMFGCEADGKTFTLAHTTVGPAQEALALMRQWRLATLSAAGVAQSGVQPQVNSQVFKPGNSLQLSAQGRRVDGTPLVVSAAWFLGGQELYQAAIYASGDEPDVVQFYWEGLHWRP